MNVKVYRITLSLVILIIVAAVAAILLFRPKTSEPDAARNVRPATAAYTLREYDEQIGVFRSTENEPFMMIDVYVANLPAADQMELRNSGIPVEDDTKLQTLIEDYGS